VFEYHHYRETHCSTIDSASTCRQSQQQCALLKRSRLIERTGMSQPTSPDQRDHNPRQGTRRTMDSEGAARSFSKGWRPDREVKVTWQFVEDPARLKRLVRLLFDQDIDREPTESSGG
jgi:hypothetical protein